MPKKVEAGPVEKEAETGMNNSNDDDQDGIKAIIKSATMKFSEYSCLTEAIKKQKESIIKFGDL